MKVIRERNEEVSGTSFWRQKRGDALSFSDNAVEAVPSASASVCRALGG